jgi:hypothetical protein
MGIQSVVDAVDAMIKQEMAESSVAVTPISAFSHALWNNIKVGVLNHLMTTSY